MHLRSRLLIGGAAAGALAVIAGCGSSSSSSSSSASNPFGSASVSVGGSVSIPTLPGGLPGISLSSSSQSGSLDACTAMSQSTAAQLSGVPSVAKLSGNNVGGVSECTYADTSGGSNAGAVALIENVPGLAGSTALQAAMNQAANGGSSNAEPLSGLGDTALKSVEANAATVAFAKGSTLVVLSATGTTRDGTSIESDLESLAHQIEGQV